MQYLYIDKAVDRLKRLDNNRFNPNIDKNVYIQSATIFDEEYLFSLYGLVYKEIPGVDHWETSYAKNNNFRYFYENKPDCEYDDDIIAFVYGANSNFSVYQSDGKRLFGQQFNSLYEAQCFVVIYLYKTMGKCKELYDYLFNEEVYR